MYLTNEIVFAIFEAIDNIVEFKTFMIINKTNYEVSKLFTSKKDLLLLKYFMINNTKQNYKQFKNTLYSLNFEKEIIIEQIFDYYLNNYKHIVINKNNLNYYDLHYFVVLLSYYSNLINTVNIPINLVKKIKGNNIKIFYDRIFNFININNSITYTMLINLKNDELLSNSLTYLHI